MSSNQIKISDLNHINLVNKQGMVVQIRKVIGDRFLIEYAGNRRAGICPSSSWVTDDEFNTIPNDLYVNHINYDELELLN